MTYRPLSGHGRAVYRHGPARPGHPFQHSTATGGPDEPGHDEEGPGHDEEGPGHDEEGPGHDEGGPGHDEGGPGHDEGGGGRVESQSLSALA